MALVFTFMKVLDPSSTVREGEYANAQNAPGVSQKIINQYNKILDGELLTPKGRAGFVNTANILVNSQLGSQKKLESTYKGYADKYGLDANEIVGKTSSDVFSNAPPIKPGKYSAGPGLDYEVEAGN